MLAACLLTSCSPSAPRLPATYPADLAAECPALPELARDADVYDLGEYTVDVVGKYRDCSERHARLASLLEPSK